jgi:peptidoglycan/xylan/chitin deacetylase (PgdA/CDA1 family)
VRWLRLLRYTLLGLDEYVRHRADHSSPPPRSVVITFDDGYRDNAELAHPILHREGASATIFLVSDSLGTSNTWAGGTELADRPLMTWEQAETVREAGVELGVHTKTHTALPGLPRERLDDETARARAELEARLGPMRHFAYPYGKVDEAATAAVERAGFESASGIEEGRNCAGTPLLALRRCEIRGTDSLLTFARTLVLGKRP